MARSQTVVITEIVDATMHQPAGTNWITTQNPGGSICFDGIGFKI